MDYLRPIAVTVSEPEAGHFYWILIESGEDPLTFTVVRTSLHSFDSWGVAFDAGVDALRVLAVDQVTGPRAPA